MIRTKVNEIAVRAHAIPQVDPGVAPRLLIPTGSTLFNLALSDNAFGAFASGKLSNIIGDSSSGKSMLALSCFAEMASYQAFDNYRFIYDDVEAACEFDLAKMLGQRAADRMEPPRVDDADGSALTSDTIQDFQANVLNAIERGEPFVYVLDSFDALTSEEERGKVRKNIAAREAGRETAGSYGMEKAKMASQILRMIARDLKRTASSVIIISQTRDNIDPMSFQKKTRAGGRALRFYASYEVWTAVGQKIKQGDVVIGNHCLFKSTKNKITGKWREGAFPIFYDYGIDDVNGCIRWMMEQGAWRVEKVSVVAPELDFRGTPAKLVEYIEAGNRERELREAVGRAWLKREESLRLDRKPRYS